MFINPYKLGQRISRIRKSLDLTQDKLAEMTGFSSHYIGNIEQGVRSPSVDALLSISVALKTTPNELLSDSLPQELLNQYLNNASSNSLRDSMYYLSTLTDLFDNHVQEGDLAADEPIPKIRFMRLDEPFENDLNPPLKRK